MARITDPSKLEKIKASTMELIIRNGYRGVTISSIAKDAGVSAGYLYRHFDSKLELIDSLVEDCVREFRAGMLSVVRPNDSFETIVEAHMRNMVDVTLMSPLKILFLNSLMNDTGSDLRSELAKYPEVEIKHFFDIMTDKGKHDGIIGDDFEVTDLMIQLIIMPFQYIRLKLDGSFEDHELTERDVMKLKRMCINALRQ